MASGTDGAEVYKTWPDGFLVRRMTKDDAKTAMEWYNELTPTSCDLDLMLDVYPPHSQGFYAGEYQGELVASVVRLPFVPGVYYGSYFYVKKECRRLGFGRRIRDEVADGHVGDGILAIDAHDDLLDMNKRHGYKESFKVTRYTGKVTVDATTRGNTTIVPVDESNFSEVIAYDNTCFVRPDSDIRRTMMQRWVAITDGAAVAAVDETGHMTGYGCRRPTMQKGHHLIGPLYADSYQVALDITHALCKDINGANVCLDICMPNEEAVRLVTSLGFHEDLHMIRMHRNGDPHEYNPRVYGITSIDVCGF